MQTTTPIRTIEETTKALIQHIADECKTIDRETAFAESLDESGGVNVAGLTFMPSRIWQELDPTAFRCGVNDHADAMDWTEIDGETYDTREAEAARDQFVSDLESEAETLEEEITEEEERAEALHADGETADAAQVFAMLDNDKTDLSVLRDTIETLTKTELFNL
jgi:hypothetical protein